VTEQLRSGLIAGLIAAVIWMIITVLVDLSKAAIVGGGLAFLVGTMQLTGCRTMGAKNPVRRRLTAAEAAERFGASARTIQRLFAEPRQDFLDRAKQRRETAAALRDEGLSYRQIAEKLSCSTGAVGALLHEARKNPHH